LVEVDVLLFGEVVSFLQENKAITNERKINVFFIIWIN
jgi:uncharacterized membrane protein YbaN (DUF454 family)